MKPTYCGLDIIQLKAFQLEYNLPQQFQITKNQLFLFREPQEPAKVNKLLS